MYVVMATPLVGRHSVCLYHTTQLEMFYQVRFCWLNLCHISGSYLAAEVDHDTTFDPMRQKLRGTSDMVYHLAVDPNARKSKHTIFELDSTTIQKGNQMIPRYLPMYVCVWVCVCVCMCVCNIISK